MVEIAFFLRFMPQLVKIRGELISGLIEQINEILEQAGGKIIPDNNLIRAEYISDTPGFWIEMLLLIENIKRITENASADLYGFSLLLVKNSDTPTEQLCRSLTYINGEGIFLNKDAAIAMRPYVNMENINTVKEINYYRITDVKIFIATAKTDL